jgi:hypothetical protein
VAQLSFLPRYFSDSHLWGMLSNAKLLSINCDSNKTSREGATNFRLGNFDKNQRDTHQNRSFGSEAMMIMVYYDEDLPVRV